MGYIAYEVLSRTFDLAPRLTAHRVVSPYGIGTYAISRLHLEVDVEVYLG
jgi:hypothetical protein